MRADEGSADRAAALPNPRRAGEQRPEERQDHTAAAPNRPLNQAPQFANASCKPSNRARIQCEALVFTLDEALQVLPQGVDLRLRLEAESILIRLQSVVISSAPPAQQLDQTLNPLDPHPQVLQLRRGFALLLPEPAQQQG